MTCKLKNQGLYETRREHDACGIGAIVNISGKRDHSIIEYGRQILLNLHHRGAAGADEATGDGAGILFQIPHDFFIDEAENLGFSLPPLSKYGVGMVFGPRDQELRKKCDRLLEDSIIHYGMKLLGWRDVPSSNDCLGKIALMSEPTIKQIFVDGAGMHPYEFNGNAPYDGGEQADLYWAALEAVAGKDWIEGVYWWNWLARGGGGAANTDYTPNGKPAEAELAGAWNG